MTKRYSTRLLTAAGAVLLTPGLAVTGLAGTALAAPTPHGRISTVIGGRGGPAPATHVSIGPCALKYLSGELYFSSYQAVVDRVSQRTGLLTSIAGNGVGPSGEPEPSDGTPALTATLGGACGVTVDRAGNVLVAGGARVFVVAAKTGTFYGKRMTARRIYAVASGFEGVADGKGAISGGAVDVQLDSSGNQVIAVAGTQKSSHPEGDSRVFVYAGRAGTFYGVKMAKGRLYHIGGSLDGYTLANAVPASQADLGVSIGTVRLDWAGNVVIADQAGNGGGPVTGVVVPPQVRVIASRTGTFYGQRMKAGYIYKIAGGGTRTGDGVPAIDANLLGASGATLDHAGNVLVGAASVRVIAVKSGVFYGRKMTAGDIYTLPGFSSAASVAVDTAGNVLAASYSDIQMLVEKAGSYYGKSLRASRVYTIAGNGQLHSSGDGGPATSAELTPAAVATFRSGSQTAVVDEWVGRVRVVPGRTGTFFGRPMRAGFIYTVASLGEPVSVAYDPRGNLLISDERSSRVLVVACKTGPFYGQKMTAGHVYTVAGGGTKGPESGVPARDVKFEGGDTPIAVATDAAGDALVIASSGIDSAYQVWMVAARTGTRYGHTMTSGDIYLVAGDGTSGQAGDGGPATAAEIESQGITVDGYGNLVLADESRVRVVAGKTGNFYGRRMTVGDIYTVAGGGTQTGDGTPALKASLGFRVLQVAADPAGNLLAGGYNTVFMVAEQTGRFYAKAAHAGDVYTVALSKGIADRLGDSGPSVGAMFNATGIAVAPQTGNLLIADTFTDRVRSVSR